MSNAPASEQLLRFSEQLAQAEHLRLKRQFDKAESLCSQVLRQYPDCFGALYTLGLIHADRNDPAKALPYLLRAVMKGPRNPLAAVSLAGVLIENSALDLASHIVDLALAFAPDDPAALATLGELSHRKNDYLRARDAFRAALERDPAFDVAAAGLGRALLAAGEMEEGVRILEAALARGCCSVDILFVLSQAPEKLISRDLAADADRFLASAGPLDAESVSCIDFVKAGALHRAGRHAQAWAAMREANKRVFARRQKDDKPHAARFEESIAAVSRMGRIAALADAKLPVSLFILGPSRSGKTSLENLVATSSSVRRRYERSLIAEATRWTFQAAGMLDAFSLGALPQGLAGAFAKNYAQLLQEDGAAALHSFTNPEDIHNVARLATRVANVRIVCIKRNLEDNALRIAMSHYHQGNAYAYDFDATLRYLQNYNRLIDALAAAAPGIVRVISYEDMVAEPAAVLKQVADLTGVALEEGGAVATGDDRGCAAPYLDLLRG